AAAIVGLPESPITGVRLQNVKINARKGATIGYAEVSGERVVIQPEEGPPINQLVGAKVTLR
ncbi:MAG: glycoside hydrolase family 28 protein, partial [Terracidiphilus sp.]